MIWTKYNKCAVQGFKYKMQDPINTTKKEYNDQNISELCCKVLIPKSKFRDTVDQ